MKFSILAVLVVFALQVEWASSCTFQREDELRGKRLSASSNTTETECFAKCLNHEVCTGLCYEQATKHCYLFAEGDREQPYSARPCYSLHRDLAKPPQYSRILNFIRKNSIWTLA